MKRLALFCDGTWNGADQARDGVPCPTNVGKLALRVAKRDAGVPQVVHYGQGVGTGNSLDRLTGGAFGDGLVDNVHAAYRFLIANYEPGDELYFFGFSRGAFTARSLVGVIRKCGILDRGAVGRYAEATSLYRSDDGPDAADPLEFRRSCAIGGIGPVAVKFIGVWDTVGALGIPLRGLRGLTRGDYAFHDVELSGIVEHAYQALAIDERRPPRFAHRHVPAQRPASTASSASRRSRPASPTGAPPRPIPPRTCTRACANAGMHGRTTGRRTCATTSTASATRAARISRDAHLSGPAAGGRR